MQRSHLRSVRIGRASDSLLITHGLLNWSGIVEAVTLQDVDVIELESLETRFYGVKDMLQRRQNCEVLIRRRDKTRTFRFKPYWLMIPSSCGSRRTVFKPKSDAIGK